MKKFNCLILVLIMCNSVVFSQSIDKSKKELNAKKSDNSTSNSNSSSGSHVTDYDPETVWFGLKILGFVSYGALIGDYENETHLHNNLNKNPFSDAGRGNYSETDSIGKTNFRLDIENKFVTAGNAIKGNHLDVKIRPSKYFYLTTNWYQLFKYNTFTKKNDALSLFYFNFAYDRYRGENFNIGWTIGASYVGNEVQKGGFSYGLNAEYFMNKNISLSINSKWSSINQSPVNSLEIKGKFIKKNYFGSVGYERLKIGTPVYNLIGIGAGIYF